MKLHKVDIDHLPTEEVLAINFADITIIGRLSVFNRNKTRGVICKNSSEKLGFITHYILRSDIIKAKEQLK